VNDASTDNTAKILDDYAASASFPVKIIHNPVNKMLYYNFNLAFKEAEGELMVFAGHDDMFHSEALEIFAEVWQKNGNSKIAGIWCLCQDQHGVMVGNSFEQDFMVSNYFELFEKSIYTQERFGCTRTDILKQHPFNLKSEKIGESFLWEAIGAKFNTIYINKILRTYFIEPENQNALTKSSRSKNAGYVYISYLDWINLYLKQYTFSIKFKLRYHFAFLFYGLLSNRKLGAILSDVISLKNKIILMLIFPFVVGVKFYMRIKGKL
jgi:glycosyltransferase involved in cell wall biosynthesis